MIEAGHLKTRPARLSGAPDPSRPAAGAACLPAAPRASLGASARPLAPSPVTPRSAGGAPHEVLLLPSASTALPAEGAAAAPSGSRAGAGTGPGPNFGPTFLPSGHVGEPQAQCFFATCVPAEGGGGIQSAVDACPLGGSILLSEGVYLITTKLVLRRSIHLFGRGKAELRCVAIPDQTTVVWIEGPGAPPPGHVDGPLARITLDRIRIVNEDRGSWAVACMPGPNPAPSVAGIHVRLQECLLILRAGRT